MWSSTSVIPTERWEAETRDLTEKELTGQLAWVLPVWWKQQERSGLSKAERENWLLKVVLTPPHRRAMAYVHPYSHGHNKPGKDMTYFNTTVVLSVDVKDGSCPLEMPIKTFTNKITWRRVCFGTKRELAHVTADLRACEPARASFTFVRLTFYGGKKLLKRKMDNVKRWI